MAITLNGTTGIDTPALNPSGSNVGIGTTVAYNSSRLSVNGTISSLSYMLTGGNGGSYWRTGAENSIGTPAYVIYNANGTGQYMLWGNTSWNTNSDERLKTDLIPIENAIEKVSTLRTVTGRYKTDEEGKSRVFLIAQDVQKVLPEAVNIQNDEQGTLGLAYTELIPLLVASIKELTIKVETLEAKLNMQ